jgi:hypothetical protein
MTPGFSKGVPYTYTAVINITVNSAGMKGGGVNYAGNVIFSAGGATTSTMVTMSVPSP